MNRLQKKCLIVSASCHGLLLLVLLVGPAFFISRDKTDSSQTINMVAGAVLDNVMSSGGRPNTQEAPPQAQPQQQPSPAPTPEVVKPIEPVKPPPQSKPIDRPQPQPTPEFTPVKQPKTTPVKPDEFQITSRQATKPPQSNPKPSPNKNSTDARPTQTADNSQQIATALGKINGLKSGLASAAKIEFNGTSGDSDALVSNYSDIVKSKYNGAWSAPFGTLRDPGPVTVRVTIARDGRVTRSQIISRSGDAAMDKSIQNTLDNVTFVEPFPANSKDLERTYTIEFDLSAKRSL